MLEKQRLDVVIEIQEKTDQIIRENKINNIVMIDTPYTEGNTSHLWFSNMTNLDAKLIERFSQELHKMNIDGSIKRILDTYEKL